MYHVYKATETRSKGVYPKVSGFPGEPSEEAFRQSFTIYLAAGLFPVVAIVPVLVILPLVAVLPLGIQEGSSSILSWLP
jgi:hypothetical protein